MLKGMYQIACSIDCLFLWNPIRSCFVGFFMHIIFQDKQALLCFGFILHFEKYNFDLILVCLLMNFNNIDFVLDCPIFSDQWSIDFFHSLRLHFLFPSFFENLILFLNTFFLKNTGYTTRRSFLNGVLIYRHSMTDTFFSFSS